MTWIVLQGDATETLKTLDANTFNCVVCSPPYWGLRDYEVDGQIGLEDTFEEFLARLVTTFEEVRRVLRKDGVMWLNMGDSKIGNPPATLSGERFLNRGRLNENKRKIRPYNLKLKDTIGQPWRLAFALQAAGWYLRQDIIWHKPNPMPESCRDRPTVCHEYIFLFSKSRRYHYDAKAIQEECSESTHLRVSQDVAAQIGSERAHGQSKKNGPMKAVGGWKNGAGVAHDAVSASRGKTKAHGRNSRMNVDSVPVPRKYNSSFAESVVLPVLHRNKRSVWTIPTESFKGAHFATFPKALVEPCILAGCPVGGRVLDPFAGSGTTGVVATTLHRSFCGIELSPKFAAMARRRIAETDPGGRQVDLREILA
jgi:DNA modification methylase